MSIIGSSILWDLLKLELAKLGSSLFIKLQLVNGQIFKMQNMLHIYSSIKLWLNINHLKDFGKFTRIWVLLLGLGTLGSVKVNIKSFVKYHLQSMVSLVTSKPVFKILTVFFLYRPKAIKYFQRKVIHNRHWIHNQKFQYLKQFFKKMLNYSKKINKKHLLHTTLNPLRFWKHPLSNQHSLPNSNFMNQNSK
jgi:hypothetical protein